MSYNLLPTQYRPQKPLYIGYVLSVVYIALTIGVAIYAYDAQKNSATLIQQKNEKSQQLADYELKNNELSTQQSGIDQEIAKDQEYARRKRMDSEFTSITNTYNMNHAEFLQKIGTITPMEVGIQSIISENRRITIEAKVASKEYFDLFEKNVKGLNIFSAVSQVSSSPIGIPATSGNSNQSDNSVNNGNLYRLECIR